MNHLISVYVINASENMFSNANFLQGTLIKVNNQIDRI